MSQSSARVIFDAAVDLPTRERREYVARACAGVKAMEDRVLALLEAHEGMGRFLGTPENPTVRRAAKEPAEQAGEQIGPYRLLSVVGSGAFGTVWLAERREPFVQRVAMKIINPGMDSRAVIARFEQERQALAVMDHPNVAKVLDGGLTPRGRPYFVMEYVKGEPITTFCDKNRLTIRQRLELFIPVCEAVQHAHMKGIIHRDIKPANILVAMSDAGGGVSGPEGTAGSASDVRHPTAVRGGLVKVIDFGVAKAIAQTLTEKTIFTEQGQIIGTPEYMSPEQAEMGAVDIDTRTDVYSLGVVLYELLSGALPFDPRALRSRGYNEIQRIIREVDPPKPSMRLTSLSLDEKDAPAGGASALEIARHRHARLGDLVRELRRELDWVPLMAMRKDRRVRYQSAQAVAEDIQRYLRGQPLMAGPESVWYRARKFVRRHRWGVGVTAAGLVALAGFGVISRGQYLGTLQAKRGAEWSAYVANIGAAGANVELGSVGEARRRLEECPERLRGWEWNYVGWRADWSAHRNTEVGEPFLLRFAPDGSDLLGVVLRHSRRGEEIGVVHMDPGLGILPGGWSTPLGADVERVLGADQSGEAVLVKPEDYKRPPEVMIQGRAPLVTSAREHVTIQDQGSMSPDGKRAMVSALGEGGGAWVLLVDTADGGEVARVAGFGLGGWIKDGAEFITFDEKGLVRRSSVDGRVLEERPWSSADVPRADAHYWPQIAAVSDGSAALICGQGGEWVVSARDGSVVRVGNAGGTCPSISADGSVGAWLEGPGVTVRALGGGRALRIGLPGTKASVALRPDGKHLVAGVRIRASRDETDGVLEWNLEDDSPVDWGAGAFAMANWAVAGDGGTPLVVHGMRAGTDGARTWVVRPDGRETEAQFGAGQPVCAAAAGNAAAFADRDGRISVRSGGRETWAWEARSVEGASGKAFAQSISFVGSSGAVVASVKGLADEPRGRAIVVFEEGAATGRVLGQLDNEDATVVAGPSGLVAAAAGRTLKVWSSVSAAAETHQLPRAAHSRPGAQPLALNQTNTRLAIGGAEGGVMVYETGSGGGRVYELNGKHGGAVVAAAFTPDGSRLLTGSSDGTIKVWDPASRTALLAVNMGSPVLHLCFPEGKERALAVMEDGSIRWLSGLAWSR